MNSLPVSVPSQTVYPWRATVRTVFQVLVSLATLIPFVVATGGLPADGVVVAWLLTACAVVTKVMAHPATNELLSRFAPWLLAEPRR